MKTKTFLLGTLSLVALSLGFSSCSGSGDSMFGKIPSIYEEEMTDVLKNMNSLMKKSEQGVEVSPEEALQTLNSFQTAMDKAKEKAQPLAEKMVGNTIPYSVNDSLPYRIASDITVTEVHLPELSWAGGATPTQLEVEFDAVFTQQQAPVKMYYFIMADDQPIDYQYIWETEIMEPGDTLHVQTTITAPDVSAEHLKSCDELRFVTSQTFRDNQTGIDKLKETWNKAHAKELFGE